MFNSVSEYPHWLVETCTIIAAVFVIWIILKILKVALWIFLVGVLVVGGATAFWMLTR
jgi:hypothetical protein